MAISVQQATRTEKKSYTLLKEDEKNDTGEAVRKGRTVEKGETIVIDS